jgi:hypothetical protein
MILVVLGYLFPKNESRKPIYLPDRNNNTSRFDSTTYRSACWVMLDDPLEHNFKKSTAIRQVFGRYVANYDVFSQGSNFSKNCIVVTPQIHGEMSSPSKESGFSKWAVYRKLYTPSQNQIYQSYTLPRRRPFFPFCEYLHFFLVCLHSPEFTPSFFHAWAVPKFEWTPSQTRRNVPRVSDIQKT